MTNIILYRAFGRVFLGLVFLSIILIDDPISYASPTLIESIQACVIARDKILDTADREHLAECLGWMNNSYEGICRGSYQAIHPPALSNSDEMVLVADRVSLYPEGRSTLQGHVELKQTDKIVNAETAYVYRDAASNTVSRIELLGQVRYLEPDRLMIAKSADVDQINHIAQINDAIYRFNSFRAGGVLPAWGRASVIKRFANEDVLLQQATYTTCPIVSKAWQLEAKEITLDKARARGVAKHTVLRVGDVPIFYSPYLNFPATNARQSGFLMPIYGYSNIGGFDLGVPYYLNLAPNYDATLVPHLYTQRGVMMGGELRVLTENSSGVIGGQFLPDDQAFGHFLIENQPEFPVLQGISSNRWSFLMRDTTYLTDRLTMNLNYKQVSDDYYLQDFSTNLALMTENQLLRQGDLTYTTDHWLLRGMLQDYQTLHAINQSAVSDVYARLPQLLATGFYDDLPLHSQLQLNSQFDYFHWPSRYTEQPQGPRYHLNPILSFPRARSWGYLNPEIQLVENYYDLSYIQMLGEQTYQRTIPRYSVDAGLVFERDLSLFKQAYTQTLEPRLYYLNVPYQNQSAIPAFDSAYMIFTQDQLFRDNRFSGFDRIGDANQIAYGLTSRWLSGTTGQEKGSIAVGQIRYFSNRRVQLCYNYQGQCTDEPLTLGYLSPTAKTSPIASRANYQINASWNAVADYVWDPATQATNNGDVNLHYQPAPDRLISLGYGYLVSGNNLEVPHQNINTAALNQITAAYAWPLTESWSTLGVYSYNISEGYDMMTFFGIQYNGCCWAARLFGGRTFKSLAPDSLQPRYNNNVFVQILLKGLGSVKSSDPGNIIQSYLPGYNGVF